MNVQVHQRAVVSSLRDRNRAQNSATLPVVEFKQWFNDYWESPHREQFPYPAHMEATIKIIAYRAALSARASYVKRHNQRTKPWIRRPRKRKS